MALEGEGLSDEEREEMFDEAAGFIADNYPRALRSFYKKCELEGFTETQTMRLVAKYFDMLLVQASNAANCDTEDTESDEEDDDDDN